MRSNAIIIITNNDKYCLLRSTLVYLQPCEYSHPSTVTNCIHYSNELNIECFDFANGFKCSDVQKFEKLNSLSINVFEKKTFIKIETIGNMNYILLRLVKMIRIELLTY